MYGVCVVSTVEFRGISKYFPGVKALDSISFTAQSGYVYAFLGENGAGKSTLLKIMNGDYQSDFGELLIDGEVCNFPTPKHAIAHGISVIYQERQILKEMTVAENVFLGNWLRTKQGSIDYQMMNEKTAAIAAGFGLDIEPDVKVGTLSTANQQMIEIMKAVIRDAKIIAFDEPTASLSDKEIGILFGIIEKLKAEGKLIFYVSHRMNEISQIAQKVVVFKDGHLVDVVNVDSVTNDDLIRMMVGRPLGKVFEELSRNTTFGETILDVKGLTTDYVTDVSFSARKGEILGFSGLVGAGRTEIMRALFGLDKIKAGTIVLDGKPIAIKSPQDAIAHGIALVPEDRKDQGILPNLSVKGNISITVLKQYINKLFGIDCKREEEIAQKAIKELNIKTPNSDKLISQLSGGNQQKVILGRWLETKPKVLILDEPTKGIDVGAKSEFYKIICECAKLGMLVIVVSSELPELLGISDRIVVIKDGTVSGFVQRKEATEELVLKYAMDDGKRTNTQVESK